MDITYCKSLTTPPQFKTNTILHFMTLTSANSSILLDTQQSVAMARKLCALSTSSISPRHKSNNLCIPPSYNTAQNMVGFNFRFE